MRLGGAFPFNQAGSFPISLPGGAYSYLPPGNYLITLGGQTILQWWDPVQWSWRNMSTAGAPTFAMAVDGYNWRIINMSGVVQGASITTPGTVGTNGIGPTQTGCTVTIAAPASGIQAKGYAIIGGAVGTAGGTATVTQAGSGFVTPPTILIDPPPPGGIQATAVAALTAGGAITSVTMVNPGAGYTSVPNFYVVPQFLDYPGSLALPYTVPATGLPAPYFPPGLITNLPPQNWASGLTPASGTTGALITGPALAGSATLTGLVVTDYGSGYLASAIPAITFANGPTSAAATAILSTALLTLTGGSGTAYTVGNAWVSSLGLLTPATAPPITTAFYNNNWLQPRPARGVLTSTAGALTMEDPGFGFQKLLIAANFGVLQSSSIGTGSIVFSAMTQGGINDTSILQMMIND
jgi:hypothetical protein